MGGSPSKMPPIRQRDPLPDSDFATGFSVGQSQGCKRCILTIAQGISASGAKLYREQGTISFEECEIFKTDGKKVNASEMAFDEFKAKLTSGKYFNELPNGFCAQMVFKPEDMAAVREPSQIPWDKVKVPSIRKLTSGGGFSSITKLFIKPAIPFTASFNGEPIQVSIMTLFHPCPIRIDNVQYDAVLTLGDVADQSTKTIVMVPLAGSLNPGKAGTFFSKIASFIPGILLPDPSTGQYEPIDIPTGKDWDISKIFPGSPSGTATVVDASYYVWNEVPPLELYLRNTIANPMWLPNIEQYGWRPTTNAAPRKFIMLGRPININTFDLQTIRMLPATPPEDAIPSPLLSSLVFKPNPKCDAGKEKFTMDSEKLCDPFARIAEVRASKIDTDAIIAAVLGVITIIAVCLGIYFALKYSGQPIGIKAKEWGEKLGKMLAGMGRKLPPPPSPPSDVFEVENPLVQAKREEDKKKADEAAKEERARKLEEAGEAAEERAIEAKRKREEDIDAKIEAERKETEKEQEKVAKALFDEQESKKKELKAKMDDTSLSEEEQRRIREEYKELTGIYTPTKKEQEAAAGTGLVKRRIIAPEPEDTAEVPAPIAAPPPAAAKAKAETLEKKKEEMSQEQKDRIARARERIAKAMTETQERKAREQLEDTKKKTAEDKEKVDRDLADARARLRSSMAVYRRGQQKRNLYTGRGKTSRN
jgi:hypothetical protein